MKSLSSFYSGRTHTLFLSSLLAILFPVLTFAQVRMDNLIRKHGIAYEMGSRAPFTGQALAYFPNGDTATIVEYKEGIPNGKITSWYGKDHKQLEGFVEQGQKTGVWKLYYQTGKIQKQTSYIKDVEDGEETFWFENGSVEKKGTYSNGILNGKYDWYFDNGQRQQEGYYAAGKQDSTWSDWYANGQAKMQAHFVKEEKDGDWTWWDSAGKVTDTKTYKTGLVITTKDNVETYLEKMEYYISRRNFKEALKNVELADAKITDKSDTNQVYMGVVVYHAKCYSLFTHYREGEKILLDGIAGMTPLQTQTIQSSDLDKSPAKIQQIINNLLEKDKANFKPTYHIGLALCYTLLGDSANFQKEQQISMLKGGMKDWIITGSLELYRLSTARTNNYQGLADVNARLAKLEAADKKSPGTIKKDGSFKTLELEKAQYLIGNERFDEAQKILDKYLAKDSKDLTALLLRADLATAVGDVEKMKLFEDKAVAIDPNALTGTRQ